jgi:hypothetical protein
MAPVESLDYISQLKTPLECETVMKHAKAKRRADVYDAALRRKCELAGLANEDPNDPLIRAFYETLSAREELLREKHGGKHIKAAYTRRMVQKYGVVYADFCRRRCCGHCRRRRFRPGTQYIPRASSERVFD